MSSKQIFSYIQDEKMFTINQYVGWKRGTDKKIKINATELETRKSDG
jgi:hypothetical protein